jgi:heme/copper-type cytochrome/quinol oxidase subunit 2
MSSLGRPGLTSLLAALASVLVGAAHAVAQSTTDTAPAAGAGNAPGSWVMLAVMLGVLVLVLASIVKIYDSRRRRADSRMAIEARISDALMSEPGLTTMPVTASVVEPAFSGTPRIVVKGSVPNPELHDAAISVVRREAQSHLEEAEIEDRVHVDPALARHAA